MSEPGADDTEYFELSFTPNVKLVPRVRRFVGDFYLGSVSNAAATSQLAVATHELLENAVSYSADGNTVIRIGVCREAAGLRVTIETRNRASKENIAIVSAALDSLAAAKDPQKYYLEMIEESSTRLDGSGLGFARVRAEADMILSYQVEDDVIQLRAVARIAGGGGQ
jgi:hypothetical protein